MGFLVLASLFCCNLVKRAEPRRKASFEGVAVCSQKLVLQRQHPVRPRSHSLAISELIQL